MIASWESGQSHTEEHELINEISESLQYDYIPRLVELGLVEREHKYDEEYLTVLKKLRQLRLIYVPDLNSVQPNIVLSKQDSTYVVSVG